MNVVKSRISSNANLNNGVWYTSTPMKVTVLGRMCRLELEELACSIFVELEFEILPEISEGHCSDSAQE
jgi:hypothetical protein